MEIINRNIEEIHPYENNPRDNEAAVEYVANSIREFGFKSPIIIDEDDVIIAGHTRLKAAKLLGLDEVPCIKADDLTEDQVKAYRLADNKVGEIAEWDLELLDIELEGIDLDMEEFGFDMQEDEPEEPEVEEDDFDEELPEEPQAQYGDIYQLGRHRLMCGDATKEKDVEALMEGQKVDMVFTDPPYGIDVVSDDGKVGADFGVAQKGIYSKVIADDTTDTAKESYNIYKMFCDRMIIWGGNYFTEFLEHSDGWLVWDKRADSGIRNTFADGEMAYCSFHTPLRIYRQLWNGMIREGEKDKRVHPTQKPVKMLGEILSDFTKKGDIVLDVFSGSGSILIACEQMGRTCYAMELDPHYVDVIIRRWEEFSGEEAMKVCTL